MVIDLTQQIALRGRLENMEFLFLLGVVVAAAAVVTAAAAVVGVVAAATSCKIALFHLLATPSVES